MLNYSLKLFSYNELFNEFINLDLNNKLPTRLLLTGQEGIGKSTFSFHFINYLLSKNEKIKYNKDEYKISSESISYKLVNNLSHPNFYLISKHENKKHIEIEQIRNMINFLNKSSFDNNKKIILIDSVEYLNANSSNALLKSLEESSQQNLFILTQNINKNIYDTIKSRCITYKLNFNYSENKNIISQYFNSNLYDQLNSDFKSIVSPLFLINHINFTQENNLDLKSTGIKSIIKFIIDNKSYKKSTFVTNNFQNYIEIYFSKLYSSTKDYKYYDNFLQIVAENNLFIKFNLDLDSFFVKFENKYLNI